MTSTGLRRRDFLQQSAAAVALAGLPLAGCGRGGAPRPNVLVLLADQHRADVLGCAGDEQAHTPALDALAASGTRFSRAVSSAPLCAPFRATLQSGLHAHQHGVQTNLDRLSVDAHCLAERFAGAGYATGYIGKWHLDGDVRGRGQSGFVPPGPRRQGWQEFDGYQRGRDHFDVWRYDADGTRQEIAGYEWEPAWQTEVALDFAERHSGRGTPWLYLISYGPPHKPESCPERFRALIPRSGVQLPPGVATGDDERDEALRSLWRAYYAQVAGVDHEVGRLLAGIDRLGLTQDTLVIYLSDHGDRLGSHTRAEPGDPGPSGKPGAGPRGKGEPYASAFRIPLIVRHPGRVRAGAVSEALLGSVDLLPTILGVAGLPSDPSLPGLDLSGHALSGAGPAREAVYLGLGGQRSWRAVWDGDVLYSPAPYEILYRHSDDPAELHNRHDDPGDRELLERARGLLARAASEAGALPDDPGIAGA